MPSLQRDLRRAALVAALVLYGGLAAGADYFGAKQYELSKSVRGVHFQITVFQSEQKVPALRLTVDKAFAAMKETLDRMSRDGSDGAVALDAAELELVTDAVRFSELSGGAYDPTTGALTELWTKAKAEATPPSKEASDAARTLSGTEHLSFNTTSKFVEVTRAGVKLDIRDLAEGFAMDRAADILKKNGVRSAVIQTSTAVLCVGEPETGRVWRVAIEHPRSIEGHAALLELPKASALATVGDYDDFFMYKGKRHTVIADPRTGRQPTAMLASATAIAPNAAFAKVLSRTFFVLGSEQGFALVSSLKDEGVDVICLEEDRPEHFNLGSSEAVRGAIKEIYL